MKLEQIINSTEVFKLEDDEIWQKYHVPSKLNPPNKYGVCGSLIMNFKSNDIKNIWLEIYYELVKTINDIEGINHCLEFCSFQFFDEVTIRQARPFNEGYTTDSYKEYLLYGSCQPNEWIIKSLCSIHVCLSSIQTFDEENINDINFSSKDIIIKNIIHKSLIKPNMELYWTGDTWTLYLPLIDIKHIFEWQRISEDNNK